MMIIKIIIRRVKPVAFDSPELIIIIITIVMMMIIMIIIIMIIAFKGAI